MSEKFRGGEISRTRKSGRFYRNVVIFEAEHSRMSGIPGRKTL